MISTKSLAVIAVSLLCASCARQVQDVKPPVRLVSDIISDKTSHQSKLLGSFNNPVSRGDICIIGNADACMHLSDDLCTRDERDNVDGSAKSDGLLDFAGETFACIIDSSDFRAILSESEDLLRTRTVCQSVLAVDTLSHISPYDMDGLDYKNYGKIIILANPYLSAYGKYDVEYLFSALGCRIPVIVPFDLMMDKFTSSVSNPENVGILCNQAFSDTGIYETLFREYMSSKGIQGCSCMISGHDGNDGNIFRTFLDKYIASGATSPLDAVLIDDFQIDLESLKGELAEVISVMNESSLIYGPYISENFQFVFSADAVFGKSFELMRKLNLFTHNISMPKTLAYNIITRESNGKESLVLLSGNYVPN